MTNKHLIDSILSSYVFDRFIKAKNAFNNSKELSLLKEEINVSKRNLAKLKQEEIPLEIKRIKSLEERYDNHPLNLNYQTLKKELLDLLSPIQELFNNLH